MVLDNKGQILKKTMTGIRKAALAVADFVRQKVDLAKRRWEATVAIIVGVASITAIAALSDKVVSDVHQEGRAFANIFKETTNMVSNLEDVSALLDIVKEIQRQNEFVPVVLTDQATGEIVDSRNLIPGVADSTMTTEEQRRAFDAIRPSCDSLVFSDVAQVLYYGESNIVKSAMRIRVIEAAMIAVCGLSIFFILTSARRRERDTLWEGLAKETAHQIGSPLQGLTGWRDLLLEGFDPKMAAERMTADIERLTEVSELYEKIGNSPTLEDSPLNADLAKVVAYMQKRTGRSIDVTLETPNGPVSAPHNPTLIRWAVENICKNAADAMDKPEGRITVTLRDGGDKAVIDIADTGKGMDSVTRSRVFETGFSTKKAGLNGRRGWGVGLALVSRIVNEYHKGKVYVAKTQVGEGTTFRIELKKQTKAQTTSQR